MFYAVVDAGEYVAVPVGETGEEAAAGDFSLIEE